MIFAVLFLLSIDFGAVFSVAQNGFEATSLFEVTANSTCGGDTPTEFIYEGEEFNCSFGDHSARFSLDKNPNTWWQSNNTDDPVFIMFSLAELEVQFNCSILLARDTHFFFLYCSLH